MIVLNQDELTQNKRFVLKQLKKCIFIYPTDTIYGIGCDARNKRLVQKIREIKKSTVQPFSVIAPSKDWIRKNCHVTGVGEKWINKLPGPYTFIFGLKKKRSIAYNVNMGIGTLGIRIPQNWFTKTISELGFPVITTSANPTGGNFMTSLEDLDIDIRNHTDYIFYEGKKKGHPSNLINLTNEYAKVKVRVK
ncbi:MAG: Sua5/YciO/YrdC/YwlC family protein [archaeon]